MRLSGLRTRLAERLSRSAHAFFVGLVCACLVEVVVDWNATLQEINQLRGALRQKGENYADILRKAAEGALLGYDWEELDRLSGGLFDDSEVVYVRFVDILGNTLYDRLRPEYGRQFSARRKEPFRAHYRHVMERDLHGIMSDPQGLLAKLQMSRHRDIVQIFNDEQDALLRRLRGLPGGTGAQAGSAQPRLLYQDRLADRGGRLDRDLTYAVGSVLDEQGTPFGAVLIAFDNAQLKRKVWGKLLKGLAVTVFFVGLILVQNVMARRTKLRLLDLEQELARYRAGPAQALSSPGVALPPLGDTLPPAPP